jgi:hypothetical protein
VNPEMLMQMIAAAGGEGGGGPMPQPGEADAQNDWLTAAINAVHAGMVEEADPKQVSLLGAILNQLTTFQANRANAAQPAASGG